MIIFIYQQIYLYYLKSLLIKNNNEVFTGVTSLKVIGNWYIFKKYDVCSYILQFIFNFVILLIYKTK